jgi:hypothetical protein
MGETLAPRSQSATISFTPIMILTVGSKISSNLVGKFSDISYI